MIDQDVIKALRDKRESAFEYVYQQTKRGVYSMIFSIVRSHPATEDIMQDVYMKMMESIGQYREKTNFNNWLLTIAKHMAIDYYRREKRVSHMDQEDYDDRQTSIETGPDEAARFEAMLDVLDSEQRTVVLLKIVDNMKFKDMARVLDKPLGTVIWVYHQALKVLRKYEGIE